jgi:hypothetical protein
MFSCLFGKKREADLERILINFGTKERSTLTDSNLLESIAFNLKFFVENFERVFFADFVRGSLKGSLRSR